MLIIERFLLWLMAGVSLVAMLVQMNFNQKLLTNLHNIEKNAREISVNRALISNQDKDMLDILTRSAIQPTEVTK